MVTENGSEDPREALLRQLSSYVPSAIEDAARVALLKENLARELAAERKTAAPRRLEQQVAEMSAKLDRLLNPPPPEPEPERRSTMSAARKSALIRSIGIEKYNALPW
jgi:hypothetical protein